MNSPQDKINGIKIVPKPSKERLHQRKLVDYRSHRKKLIKWLLNVGKDPEKSKGYSQSSAQYTAYRVDKFYRWVWDQEDGYTTDIRPEHGDQYLEELAFEDKSNAAKNKELQSLKRLFKFLHHTQGKHKWSPDRSFHTDQYQPREYFTMEERRKLREAALEYGSIPSYSNLDSGERDEWKAYLAQRFEKPKEEISGDDWRRANGWKIPSLTWVSLDTGLRPVEVERAVTSWADFDNGVLRIPKEESSKNRDNWVVSLKDKTSEILQRWIQQRRVYDKYSDTDKIWLTREGNPYQSQSLRYVLKRLCDLAGIETENRKISWYAIRHSVGTYMNHVEDLGAAKAQLRHKSEKTTLKYDQTPVEIRKDALDRMG